MKEFNEIKKDSGFKVPDNYFNNFASKMEEVIKEEGAVTKTQFSIKPILSMAAVFISALAISWVLLANFNNSKITSDDALAYLECNIDDISDDLLYESISNEEPLTNEEELNNELDYLEEEMSDEEILDNLDF